MGEVTTIGLDLAKNVFQVHGVDAVGNTVLRKRLARSRLLTFFEELPHCLVGMETCINSLRTHCAEFGIVAPQGARHVGELVARLTDPDDTRIPDLAKQALRVLVEQLEACGERLSAIEAQLMAWHQSDADSQRLATIPGVGPITATALAANLGAGTQFKSGRDMAAWLGLVPRQHSSGDKVWLGAISKRGNSYLRRLLIHGARSVLRWQAPEGRPGTPWVKKLIKMKHANVVATAMANKNARIAWSVLTRKEVYDPHRQADVDVTAALRG